jgi:hypothetical protein
MDRLAVAVLLALCLVLIGRGCAQGSAHADEIAARDVVLAFKVDSLKSARERAESLQAQAVRSDTVLVRVVDSVRVEVERAEERSALADTAFAGRTDSLRYHLRTRDDALGVALLDRIIVDHADVVRAERAVAAGLRVSLAATAENAALWRTTAEGHRHTAEVAERALAASEAASSARDDALRAKERRVWYERGAALALVALVVLK